MKFKRHVFVCQNERAPGGKPACAMHGGREILRRLERAAAHPEVAADVAVSGSTCLGLCFQGPALVVYPEGVWYAEVREEDAEEIVREHLIGGRPVERLLYRWP